MKIAKKLLVCGLSLALINSTGLISVSAHRVHINHHVQISRVMKQHHNHQKAIHLSSNISNSDDLSAHQIIQLMNFDYMMLTHKNKYSFDKRMSFNSKCEKLISNSLDNNWNNYTIKQLKQIQGNKDTGHITFIGHDEDIFSGINDILFNRALDVNQTTQQDNPFNTETRNYLINNINNTRVFYGLNPLTVTYTMQAVANYRAPHVQYAYDHLNNYLNYPHNTSNPTDNWVHGIDTHETSSDFLNHHCYQFGSLGENVGNWSNKFTENGDNSLAKYSNNTPEHIADNINDGIINHDDCEGNNNGHRKIELNPNWKHLGVRISFNPVTNQGVYDEEFSN